MKRYVLAAAIMLGLVHPVFGVPVYPIHGYTNFTDQSCGGTGCPILGDVTVLPTLTPVSITGSSVVTESFTWNYFEPAKVIYFALWAGSYPATIDWAITTQPFGGTTLGSGETNNYNYLAEERARGMFLASVAVDVPLTPGTYWLQLSNGITLGGGAVAWDVSGGPSVAYMGSTHDPILSESFAVGGVGAGLLLPEPSSATLFGSGSLLILAFSMRKLHG